MLHEFSVGLSLFAGAVPVIAITIFVASILSWLFGARSYSLVDSDGKAVIKKLPFYLVHEYSQVLATVAAMSAFGSFQGYLIGSIGFEDSTKTIASLISGAVTFLSTMVAMLYARDAPESFKRSIAPGIMGFMMCFLIFKGYNQELNKRPMLGPIDVPGVVR